MSVDTATIAVVVAYWLLIMAINATLWMLFCHNVRPERMWRVVLGLGVSSFVLTMIVIVKAVRQGVIV